MPPSVGTTVVLSAYVVGEVCSWKLAVTDLSLLMVTVIVADVPEASPLHPVKVYPAAGVAVMVASVPASYDPAPVIVPPVAGDAVVPSVYFVGVLCNWKLAVTDLLPFMVTVAEAEVPDASPLHPVKVYPAVGVAVIVTTAPASYDPAPLIEPPAAGDATVPSVYFVVEGCG